MDLQEARRDVIRITAELARLVEAREYYLTIGGSPVEADKCTAQMRELRGRLNKARAVAATLAKSK